MRWAYLILHEARASMYVSELTRLSTALQKSGKCGWSDTGEKQDVSSVSKFIVALGQNA